MVIDDSSTIRRSAEIFLGRQAIRSFWPTMASTRSQKSNDHQPALIFCDILMPRLDGYQTCALIKKSARFHSTPVVMLSSKDGLFDRARGAMVGSDAYLTKPFTKDSLLRPCVNTRPRQLPVSIRTTCKVVSWPYKKY